MHCLLLQISLEYKDAAEAAKEAARARTAAREARWFARLNARNVAAKTLRQPSPTQPANVAHFASNSQPSPALGGPNPLARTLTSLPTHLEQLALDWQEDLGDDPYRGPVNCCGWLDFQHRFSILRLPASSTALADCLCFALYV